jgi:hypothetical protein
VTVDNNEQFLKKFGGIILTESAMVILVKEDKFVMLLTILNNIISDVSVGAAINADGPVNHVNEPAAIVKSFVRPLENEIVDWFSFVHPENANVLISIIVDGNTTDDNAVQPWNADSSMVTKLLPKLTSVSAVRFLNESFSIIVVVIGKNMDVRVVQPFRSDPMLLVSLLFDKSTDNKFAKSVSNDEFRVIAVADGGVSLFHFMLVTVVFFEPLSDTIYASLLSTIFKTSEPTSCSCL